MLKNKTKVLLLLFSVIFVVMMGLSTMSAADVDSTVANSIQNTSSITTDTSTYDYTGDYNNGLSEQTTSDSLNYLKTGKSKIEDNKRSSGDLSLKANDNTYTTVPSENLTTKASGTVSGGLYHNAIQNPAFNSILGTKYQSDVSFTFVDSENSYSNIETARLYAVLYDNRDSDDYYINISVDGNNDGEFETVLENNHYITLSTTPDSTVYKLNDNITKVYTDYCLFYDITDYVNSGTVNVELNSSRGAIKCIGLIVAYNQDDSNKEINYWINLGSAWTNAELTTTFATTNTEADDVNLTQSITSSSNPTTKFNNNQLTYKSNPSGYFGIESWNVTGYYNTSKTSVLTNTPSGSFKTMAATLALTKTIEKEIAVTEVKASTYSGSVLALENNTIRVNLTSNYDVENVFNVTLSIGDEYEVSQEVSSLNADEVVSVIFENYVPTTAGDKDLTVILNINGSEMEVYSGNLTVYYNGYMGKSFTNGSNMTNSAVYEGYNSVNVFVVSDYISSGWSEKSFVFDAAENGISDSDKIVDVLYYVPYTYSKGLDISLKVNNGVVSPVSSYVDLKGFGSYNYPYGLLVYNLSGVFTTGSNSIVLTPGESNVNGLYGTYLIVVYENASEYSVISIAEDCDMLSTTSSAYGATSDNAISFANYDGLSAGNGSLIVIAGGSDNTVNVLFNNESLGSLGDYYNSSTQLSIFDSDISEVSENNVVAIQSINDNLYTYNSILISKIAISNITVSNVTFTKTQDTVLAYNNINVTVVVSNDGDVCDEANITLTIDGESKTQTVTNLGSDSESLIFNYFFTSKGVKEVSVVVDYLNGTTVEAYSGTVDVVASGYMGKSFTNGSNMTNSAVYDGYNTLNIFGNLFDYVSNKVASFTFNTSANGIIDKNKVVDVLYYQPWGTWKGQEARIDISMNNVTLTPTSQYNDQKGFGTYDYPYGLNVYNITRYISYDNPNNFVVTPVVISGYAYAYGGYIVVIYANSTNRSVITISEDCDALSANTSTSYGATNETAITYANYNNINTTRISSSYVTATANNANNIEYLIVNGNNYGNLSSQYNNDSQVAIYSADVTGVIEENNVVSVQCINDTSVYVLSTILVVNYEEPEIAVTDVKASTYSGSVLALENNTIRVNLTSNYDVENVFNVTLSIGDEYEVSQEVSSLNADEVVSVIFENYVPTTAGDKDLTVILNINGSEMEVYSGNLTVYYNGYMGKSFTNGSNMTNSAVYEGYNSVNVFVVSDYISSGWSEKSFVFDAAENGISDSDKIVDVLYYVPYTYSKGLDISLKVNNGVVSPVSSYVDLKGFGSYNYPYGLLVYNLSGVFTTGSNSIVLTPGESNVNGLYGTYLIVVYENASEYSVISIAEDCDMLSTTSSAYGATSDNAISFANYDGLSAGNGSLIVIAGGSDNTVNVLFNNESLGSLGDYYNSSTQLSIFDSDISEVSENNVVAIQSINDNLYTYNSILIVPKNIETKTQIDDITATVGETFTVYANVVDVFNNSLNDGNIVFTDENGNVLGESLVKNGVASIDLKYNKVLSINITATFTGNKYVASNNTAIITIVKKGTTIVIDPFDATIGETINITARIMDTNGNIVNGGKVIFKYNGVSLKDENNNVIQVTVVNGQATINYKVPNSWKKGINLTAKYGGTSIADSSDSEGVIIKASLRNATVIVKPATLTAKSGDTIYYIIAVYDSSNHEFINGTAVIKMDGITIGNAKVIDGFVQFNYTIPDSRRVDNYTITVVFSNSSYNRVEDNSSVLTLEMREVYIEADPVIVKNNETGVVKVKIRYTNNGEIVTTGLNVAIKVNGVTIIKSTRCNNGSIEFTLPKQYKSGSTITIVVGQSARTLSARKDISYIKI